MSNSSGNYDLAQKFVSGLSCLFIIFVLLLCLGKATQAVEVKIPGIEDPKELKYTWLIEPKYALSRGGFSDGLWCVCDKNTRLWGYVDSSDNVVLKFQYIDATPFKNGVAFVRTSKKDLSEWGVIDKKGRYLIKPQSGIKPSSLYVEEDGVSALIMFNPRGLYYGFMDLSGKILIPTVYRRALNFSEGLAVVSEGKLMGFIDTQGDWVIPPSFESVRSFSGGYAPFRSEEGLLLTPEVIASRQPK